MRNVKLEIWLLAIAVVISMACGWALGHITVMRSITDNEYFSVDGASYQVTRTTLAPECRGCHGSNNTNDSKYSCPASRRLRSQ